MTTIKRDRKAEASATGIMFAMRRFDAATIGAERVAEALRVLGWKDAADAANSFNRCGAPEGWQRKARLKGLKFIESNIGRVLAWEEINAYDAGFDATGI